MYEPMITPNQMYWRVFWMRFYIWLFGGELSDRRQYRISFWSVHDVARRCMNVQKGQIKRYKEWKCRHISE